ncbi:MAG TPA: DUF4191 domain-containing protein [Mycobacteriales bacterium]|jgi:hypothetical protein|nr:DUF4191 domain-containing protein [Mycobacteriales bacterium]
MARSRRRPAPPPPAPKGGGRAAQEPAAQGRVAQVRAVWQMTREADPRTPLIVLGPALVVLAVLVVVGVLIGHVILLSILGVLGALATGSSIFGRRATKTMYARVEGQPGAAAAVLQGIRGDWRVTPAVAFTRNQELVHRVLGRPGVVLVGEGTSVAAIRQLITAQKRSIGRVAPETPIYDVLVGDGEGQVPLRKLQPHLARLPRNLRKPEVNALETRMKALGGTNVPLPKGPVPTRIPRGRNAKLR